MKAFIPSAVLRVACREDGSDLVDTISKAIKQPEMSNIGEANHGGINDEAMRRLV